MPHDTPLITTIVAALVLAFIFGAIANRLKMPPLVGYLIAGLAVGPHSPGFVADQTLASQLAELGVILLMFGVGLHFSLKDLLSVRAVAIPGALLRMVIATGLGIGLASAMGWPLMGGVVFGLALSVSSTVVTLKALQDRHLVDSDRGRIAMGWLIVEDLAMVLALVLIPAFAGGGAGHAGGSLDAAQSDAFVQLASQVLHRPLVLWEIVALTLLKLLAFVGFMIVVGRRIIPAILHATAHTGSRELFRLAVLAIALGVAAGAAYLFGVSLALGAFFAGMILSESELSHRAAQETLPLRDAFGVLFFVSVGMLFDPSIIVRDPLPVVATLLIVLVGKSLVGFVLLVLFRRPVAAALQISAALAQIGEFSFILAALGVTLGVIPQEAQALILAGAIVSIVLNPLAFWLAERLRPRLEPQVARTSEPELGPVVGDVTGVAPVPALQADQLEIAQPTRLTNHVVLVGYGRVGTVVAGELLRSGTPLVLIEDAEGRVQAAREAGIEVIVGNAATRPTLTLANVTGARCVVIAIPNAFEAGQAVEQCRKLNGAIRIIARAHSDEEVDYLRKLGADEVIMGEREIGLGMIDWLNGENRDRTSAVGIAAARLAEQPAETVSAAPVSAADAAAVALMDLEPDPAPVDTPLAEPQDARARAVVPEVVVPLAEIEPSPRRIEPSLPPIPPRVEARPLVPESVVTETFLPETVAPAVPMLPVEPAPSKPSGAPVLDAAVIEAAAEEIEPEPRSPGAELPASLGSPAAIAVPDFAEVSEAPPDSGEHPAAMAPPAVPRADGSPMDTISRLEMLLRTPAAAPAPVHEAPASEPAMPYEAPLAAEPEPELVPEPPQPAAESREKVRHVAESDIVILPPENDRGTSAAADPLPFRSQFWDETEDEMQAGIFPSAVRSAPLHDVRDVNATRAAAQDDWIEAFERDLLGDEQSAAGAPATPPQPVTPQPIETPTPQEEPVPPAQPIETPHPAEEPQPAPQPIETPVPPEIPLNPTPGSWPARAEEGGPAEEVDALGRREPRLY